MKSKKTILITVLFLAVVAIAYAAWYSYARHEKLAQAMQCTYDLEHPKPPTIVTGPDGNPAPLYSLNGCAMVIVPPSLWDVLRGRIVFTNVPQRMKVNPYSFADILFGRYTFGPTDVGCDQSATTTDCNSLPAQNPILACYPQSPTGAEDTPIPNNSVQYVKETSRMFINMPKDLYPKDILHSWTTVSGNATAGYISNGGLPGEAEDAAPGCWSTYVEFEGSGEVDLRVKSIVEGAPDYFVRFTVSPV